MKSHSSKCLLVYFVSIHHAVGCSNVLLQESRGDVLQIGTTKISHQSFLTKEKTK